MPGCADFHNEDFRCGTGYGDMYGGYVWWICMVDMYGRYVWVGMYEYVRVVDVVVAAGHS